MAAPARSLGTVVDVPCQEILGLCFHHNQIHWQAFAISRNGVARWLAGRPTQGCESSFAVWRKTIRSGRAQRRNAPTTGQSTNARIEVVAL